MRRRAYTTILKQMEKQDPENFREQYERIETKMQLSILRSKYEAIERQRNILKQGNTNLVQQFLSNKQREQLSHLQRQVKQRTQQNTELRRVIEQIQAMIEKVLQKQKQKSEIHSFQSVRKFSIRVNSEKSIVANKQYPLGYWVKLHLQELIDEFRLMKCNGINSKGFLRMERSEKDLMAKSLISGGDRSGIRANGSREQMLNDKVKQMERENSELREKINTLTEEINKLTNTIKQMKQYQTEPPQPPIFHLADYTIPMATSQCNTEQLQQSIIYEKFPPSFMQQSIVTESYDKRISKLQKTNSLLEKDHQLAKDKIKSLNREYSKLKLDYLKLEEDKKRIEDNYERKINTLNDKIQALNKKIRQLEVMNDKVKHERQKDKESAKSTLSQHQSKIVQLQQRIQKNTLQNLHLKEQLELSKKDKQRQNFSIKQLQNERQKCKQLEKQLQQRTINFEKSIRNYQIMIEDMRKLSNEQKKFERVKGLEQSRTIQMRSNSRSRSRQGSMSTSPYRGEPSSLNDSNKPLLLTLRQQISNLQSTISSQNERYNILENSNKQLRQRLIKMIDNQQKLRKELINERIKNRTNKSISQSSKYSQRALSRPVSVKKIHVEGDGGCRRGENEDDSQGEARLIDELKENGSVNNEQRAAKDTQSITQSESYIKHAYRTLYQSNSNRQLKSHSMIIPSTNQQHKPTVNRQMKLLRQRRFDPKQTLITKRKQLPNLTDQSGKVNYDNEEIKRSQSPRDTANHEKGNKKQQEEMIVKNQKQNKSGVKLDYEPTYGRSINISTNITSPQKQSPSSKYVYRPPQPKRLSPRPNDPPPQTINSPQNKPTSFNPQLLASQNRQHSLQISQSMSNLSKGDKIIELSSINDNHKIEEQSPFVSPYREDRKQAKYISVKEQPIIKAKCSQFSLTNNKEQQKQSKNNLVMTGKGQQTKSSAEVRFARKSQSIN